MREIVLCDIRQAENQEALVVKSSMEKKVLLFDRVQESRSWILFLKKEKKSPRRQLQMSCFVRLSKTDQNTKAIRAQWYKIEKSLDFQVRDSEIPWRVYSPW